MSKVELEQILSILQMSRSSLDRSQIKERLSFEITDKTLQRRLAQLVRQRDVEKIGKGRGTKYAPSNDLAQSVSVFSQDNQKHLQYLDTPVYARERVTYNRDFLDQYKPNATFYLPEGVRQELYNNGKRLETEMAAGTYARQILHRLLIDLSYNSSRLEGNTYSRLDTQKLIEENISAEGKVHEETVMIMNHKEAIAFLVDNAKDIDINPFTVRNLHHLLSQDLLANPMASGDIRKIEVDIGQSAYHPASGYLYLKENLELLLLKAKQIQDPFEQSFFILIHISYLQAFEDVNKRTARLACNIPFIKMNQCPLSFIGLSTDDYTAALVLFYERNEVEPMVDVYRWAYLKSCEQYKVVRQSVGEIDEFRVRYRQQRKTCMGEVIRKSLHGKGMESFIRAYCQQQKISQQDRFVAMLLTDLGSLHIGAIVGTGITESQFERWKEGEESQPLMP